MGDRLLVFGWHNVESSWFFASDAGRGVRGLEQQLRILARVANVVPLGEALDALSQGRRLPRRAVAITFDDGYRDNLDQAVPLLERLGLPATFFLVPGLLSGDVRAWWEHLAWAFRSSPRSWVEWEGRRHHLDGDASRLAVCADIGEQIKRRHRAARDLAVDELVEVLEPAGTPGELFLDWDGARSLLGRGFEIGSHSREHEILTEEAPDRQRQSLVEARGALEHELRTRVRLLAYPNGTRRDYDDVTIAAAAAAGYEYAVTTVDGWNSRDTPRYELRRFVVYPERGAAGLAVPLRHLVDRVRKRADAQ